MNSKNKITIDSKYLGHITSCQMGGLSTQETINGLEKWQNVILNSFNMSFSVHFNPLYNFKCACKSPHKMEELIKYLKEIKLENPDDIVRALDYVIYEQRNYNLLNIFHHAFGWDRKVLRKIYKKYKTIGLKDKNYKWLIRTLNYNG